MVGAVASWVVSENSRAQLVIISTQTADASRCMGDGSYRCRAQRKHVDVWTCVRPHAPCARLACGENECGRNVCEKLRLRRRHSCGFDVEVGEGAEHLREACD